MKLLEIIKDSYKLGREKAMAERDFKAEMKIVRAAFDDEGREVVSKEYHGTVEYFVRLAASTKQKIDRTTTPKGLLQKLVYYIGHEIELGMKY